MKAKTLGELREQVLQSISDVQEDVKRCAQAHEVGNLAGKVVGMCKIHLERSKLNHTPSKGTWDKFISG